MDVDLSFRVNDIKVLEVEQKMAKKTVADIDVNGKKVLMF